MGIGKEVPFGTCSLYVEGSQEQTVRRETDKDILAGESRIFEATGYPSQRESFRNENLVFLDLPSDQLVKHIYRGHGTSQIILARLNPLRYTRYKSQKTEFFWMLQQFRLDKDVSRVSASGARWLTAMAFGWSLRDRAAQRSTALAA